MPRFSTRDSDRIGAAINRRSTFTTHGALRGGPTYGVALTGWDLGRLPLEYQDSIKGNPAVDYVVWSYATPIAWHNEVTGEWTIPPVKYSQTTTQHQHTARMATS